MLFDVDRSVDFFFSVKKRMLLSKKENALTQSDEDWGRYLTNVRVREKV